VKAAAAGVDASRSLVRAWMTDDPLTMSSDTLLTDALATLKTRRHRRLPIVDAGELVGMVSLSDFFRVGGLLEVALPAADPAVGDPAVGEAAAPEASA
jgi:CBS domain-containing protein